MSRRNRGRPSPSSVGESEPSIPPAGAGDKVRPPNDPAEVHAKLGIEAPYENAPPPRTPDVVSPDGGGYAVDAVRRAYAARAPDADQVVGALSAYLGVDLRGKTAAQAAEALVAAIRGGAPQ